MKKGFTMIETLIYIAIIGAVVSAMVSFSLNVSEGRNKTYVVQEVHGNTRTALDLISQRIRAATGVNTGNSTFGSDPGVLELSMAAAGQNPTIIDLTADNGQLRIKEGSSSAVTITSTEVDITNLVFTDLTPSGERENIQIAITAEYDSSAVDVEYTYSQSLTTSVSVRQ
jgi:type II secretory pathway pseudopilin PulG